MCERGSNLHRFLHVFNCIGTSTNILQPDFNDVAFNEPVRIRLAQIHTIRPFLQTLYQNFKKDDLKKNKTHSRSSKDDITRQQRRSHREKAHKMLHSKNHIRRTRILLCNPINLGPNIQRLWVRYLPCRNNSRAPRCPPIRALPHRELGLRKSTTVDLPSTVGNIVTDCIP